MSKITTFAVLGGDRRQLYLAKHLADLGHMVYTVGLEKELPDHPRIEPLASVEEAAVRSRIWILPVPAFRDGTALFAPLAESEIPLEAVLSAAQPGSLLFGGLLPKKLCEDGAAAGLTAIDYMQREELVIKNAVSTAEAAVALAIQETKRTLFGAEILLVGYGRIARAMLPLLRAFGASVTVTARRPDDLAWITAAGGLAAPTAQLEQAVQRAAVIFNTVPAPLFDRRVLGRLCDGALLIDLASAPGGVDTAAAKELGIRHIHALSLPGRYAPQTAGTDIAGTILTILNERGEL